MLDFDAVRREEIPFEELVAGLTSDDLRALTNIMVDTILGLIADCTDADTTFQPADPDAYDPFAATEEEKDLVWNLAHVIVHTTASSEESAALAAEMARGVERQGRSRYEIPWQSVTTIAQCRHRLEESRRMRLASLDMWPDDPHGSGPSEQRPDAPQISSAGRFVRGLMHDDSHLGQIVDIVHQARAARS